MMSTPASRCLMACSGVPTRAATGTLWLWARVDDVVRRRAERVDEQLDVVLERDVDVRVAAGRRPAEERLRVRRRRGAGHTVLRQRLLDEVAVALGDHRLELLLRGGRGAVGEVGGHDDVDAVRLAVDVLVDPGQLDLELLGREGERAEDAEAAGLRDGGDDVAAVGEGEDGEFDAELVAEFGFHAGSPGRS